MIPKVIHYCWLSGDPYPELIEKCIDSWRKYLPDYEYVCWDAARIKDIDSLWLQQAYKNKKYAFAADYIRLYALYHEGGVYLDTDVEVLAPLDEFLQHEAFAGYEFSGDFEPAVLGAKAGCNWIKELLGYYTGRSFIKPNDDFDTRPLPLIFMEISKKRFGFKPKWQKQQVGNSGAVVYPFDFFSPKSYYNNDIFSSDNTKTIHHFNGGWVKRDFVYRLKQKTHQILLKLGGKPFHDRVVNRIRDIRR